MVQELDNKNLQIAWAAGFVDGEGYVGVIGALFEGNVRLNPQLAACLSVSQAKREPLDRLVALFGGKVVCDKLGFYTWRLNSDKATAALSQLLPYLIAKRAQAEIVIEFQKTKKREHQGRTLPPEVHAMRLEMYRLCRELNRRFTRDERLSGLAPHVVEDDAIVRAAEN
jgi:hypothetical protein